MKNLVSTWPNLFHSALLLLAIQMAQLTLGMQASWFTILISASRFWDYWKCYLFFLPIDIPVSLSWKPERNCTNIWNAYSCLFSKPYAFISVTILPICSADKAVSDKVSDEGRTKSFLRAESALNTEPKSDRPACPCQGQTPDSIDDGITAAVSQLQPPTVFIPAISFLPPRLDSCLL